MSAGRQAYWASCAPAQVVPRKSTNKSSCQKVNHSTSAWSAIAVRALPWTTESSSDEGPVSLATHQAGE